MHMQDRFFSKGWPIGDTAAVRSGGTALPFLKTEKKNTALCCKKGHQVSETFLGRAMSYPGEKPSSVSNCGGNWALQAWAWHKLALRAGSGGCGKPGGRLSRCSDGDA